MMLLLDAGCVAVPSGQPADASLTGISPAGASQAKPVDRERLLAAVDSAAIQIKRCYRHPRIPTSGKRIATRLRVHFLPDGGLSAVPSILGQSGVTDDNRAFAARMAEAASLAVMRCAPVRLPPDLYAGGWDEIDLTFSPALLV
jgi:hypothetical protein